MLYNKKRPQNVITLNKALAAAEKDGYAVGSFSPRYIPMIRPILNAGVKTNSALIIQISQNELDWYEVELADFAREFNQVLQNDNITIPVVLHLDHTRDFAIIKEAIDVGFTSVMIDASDETMKNNVLITSKVVEYAHARDVSVEAELGKIGTTDFVETNQDEELFTHPAEAKEFVDKTRVDALAVSVGTAHGVYNNVKQPRVDYQRLIKIKKLINTFLVLHGGSGVPAEMVINSIKLPGGGISKVNIATDLELAFLEAIGREERLTNAECEMLQEKLLRAGQQAVEGVVVDKIKNYLGSNGSAVTF